MLFSPIVCYNYSYMLAFLFIISVLALSLPFSNYYLGWLAIFSIVPIIFLLDYMNTAKFSAKKQLLLIWLIGIANLAIVLCWVVQTDPTKWTDITGWQAVIGEWSVFILSILVLSFQYVIFGWLYLKLKPKLLSWQALLIIPSAWAISEASRSLLFSLAMYGKGSTIGLHWNFGVLGIAASVTPLGFMGRLLGMFGLSFVLTAIGILIFWVYKKHYKLPLLVASGLLLTIVASWLVWSPPPDSKKVQVGYTQLPQSFRNVADDIKNINMLRTKIDNLKMKNDILVLPEYSNFFGSDYNMQFNRDIIQSIVKPKGNIITSESSGSIVEHSDKLQIYDYNGKVTAQQDKTFLVPIGEYMPDFYAELFVLSGLSKNLEIRQQDRMIAQGKQPEQALLAGDIRVASLACSGAITPELYRTLVSGGAQIMTNSASLVTFTNAPFYHEQSRQFAHFMATANSRAFVQSAAGGYSFIIDANGNFISKPDKIGVYYDSKEVDLNSPKTPYTLMGEWVVYLSAAIIICLATIRSKKDQD